MHTNSSISYYDPITSFDARPFLQDFELHTILYYHQELIEIRLRRCLQLFPKTFSSAQFPMTLQRLDVSYTQINDIGLHHIFARCQELRSLNISWCKAVSRTAFLTPHLPIPLLDITYDETNLQDDDIEIIYMMNELRLTEHVYTKARSISNTKELY